MIISSSSLPPALPTTLLPLSRILPLHLLLHRQLSPCLPPCLPHHTNYYLPHLLHTIPSTMITMFGHDYCTLKGNYDEYRITKEGVTINHAQNKPSVILPNLNQRKYTQAQPMIEPYSRTYFHLFLFQGRLYCISDPHSVFNHPLCTSLVAYINSRDIDTCSKSHTSPNSHFSDYVMKGSNRRLL